MKKKIVLITVVLFAVGLFTSFSEAKERGGKGNGSCIRQQQQKKDCEKSKDGTCNGAKKTQGQGQGKTKGNGNGYRGDR